MSWCYRHLLRPFLFTQDSERIHNFTMKVLAAASSSEGLCRSVRKVCGAAELPVDLFGLKFPNPIV